MSRGLLISRDLFFTSKVTGTAAAMGLVMDVAPDCAAALQRCAETPYAAVLIDLAGDPGDPRPLCSLDAPSKPAVIAFGSHVDTERLEAARTAGCTDVMPRSKFSATLPELLKRYLA